jgi:methyltransferase (TIGR00027 family)
VSIGAAGEGEELSLTPAKANVARTAHLTAWVRTLGRLTAGSAANDDDLADRCLLPIQRQLTRLPRLARAFLERGLPGAFGYFNARTQYFDEVLRRELAAGLDQVVLLGAGFDSRPYRFAPQCARARVFVVDMPEVLAIRDRCFAGINTSGEPPMAVPIDFDRDNLGDALTKRGYASHTRTLFLWEGVTYYLPVEAVRAVLSFVSAQSGTGSSILFDYVTQAFVDGDHSTHGAARLASGWRRLGNVNRCGIAEVAAFVAASGLVLRSDLDASELERRYLAPLPSPALRAWGCMRIAHAARS